MKAREAAFRIVLHVLTRDGYSNLVLKRIMDQHQLDPADRALCTAITMGTLKHSILLLDLLGRFFRKTPSPALSVILQIGLFQILFLNRIPEWAACDESVKLAVKYEGPSSKGFVNAVLRETARKKSVLQEEIEKLDISIRYSCTPDMADVLREEYGAEQAVRILEAFQGPSMTCVRLNTFLQPEEIILDLLQKEGYRCQPGKRAGIYIQGKKNPADGLCYREGLIALQDEGAQLFVPLLDPQPGDRVLDACAAPGGKTTHLAQYMGSGSGITACDIHPHRVVLVEKNTRRMGFVNIEIRQTDMTKDHAPFHRNFDKVLLDVPCSGLGTCQSRPELKLKYSCDSPLPVLQGQILSTCAEYVRKGGILLYGTCTLPRRENKDIVEKFLHGNPGFFLEQERMVLPDGTSGGFYMARLARVSP